jgi:homoserine O-acetyltransferase
MRAGSVASAPYAARHARDRRMIVTPRTILEAVVVAAYLAAKAYARTQPRVVPEAQHGDYLVPSFTFASGATLENLRLHYRTLGTIRRGADGRVTNAVLAMHGTGGDGGQMLHPPYARVLFRRGGLLDARTHFIIIPDLLGHGASSKPSDGLRARFPSYSYDDLLRTTHALVVDGLGVDRLRLVTGASMGGMLTWMWGAAYPESAQALFPVASTPAPIAGGNRFWRAMIVEAIRRDPGYADGEYATQPHALRHVADILALKCGAPLAEHRRFPTRAAADAQYERITSRPYRRDANDTLYAFDASRAYDASRDLEGIVAPLTAVNSADDAINPPHLGIMERAIARVRRGRYVLLPPREGHVAHVRASMWAHHLARLLAESVVAPQAIGSASSAPHSDHDPS